ncbi:MAG: hypothetical protein PHE53_06460, partial [Thermoguttaceae bacterium]|nr:hypothetical protein [Thermoguttaceae bacterium]
MNTNELRQQLENSPSYRLAYQDPDILNRPESRLLRLQLEYFKTELLLQEHEINSTVIVFGSARVPPPQTAETDILAAIEASESSPDDVELKRKVGQKKKIGELSYYYEEVRR